MQDDPPTGTVIVVGSINQDLIAHVRDLPALGESVYSTHVERAAGGKGANQALAAARSGARTRFVGRVGEDDAGVRAVSRLEDAGINVGSVEVDAYANTGVAFVTIDARGANTIVVEAGANYRLSHERVVRDLSGVSDRDTVLLQCEIPAAVVEAVIDAVSERGARCILNLSPVVDIDEAQLRKLDLLIVNEAEAAHILDRFAEKQTDGLDGEPLALRLSSRLGCAVVVTLGAVGADIVAPGEPLLAIGSYPAGPVVDTVGAGDAFAGVLAAALSRGMPLAEAGARASRAAGIVVTRQGAQTSPTSQELDQLEYVN